MRSHRPIACERTAVLQAVSRRLNLSTTEWGVFLVQPEGQCLACNCGRDGLAQRGLATLERLVIDAVLKSRAMGLRKGMEARLDHEVARLGRNWKLSEEREDAQIIRIDFEKRCRIIDED